MPVPYKITQSNGIYTFVTDFGIDYTCVFINDTQKLSPILGIYDFEVYQFVFSEYNPAVKLRKNGDVIRQPDERIMVTIAGLVNDFFSNPLRVLVYICDDSDKFHAQRQRLFQVWHRKIPNNINRVQLDIGDADNLDSTIKHIGILSRKDLEHPDILQSELIDKAEDIIAKYF